MDLPKHQQQKKSFCCNEDLSLGAKIGHTLIKAVWKVTSSYKISQLRYNQSLVSHSQGRGVGL